MLKLYRSADKFLLLSLLFFSLLFLPFLGSIPYLDGNIDFVQSFDFFKGGFSEYANHNRSLHPPLKVFLSFLVFKTGGVNTFNYTLIGFFFGIIGIVTFFKLLKKLCGIKTARIATLLLGTSPMFLSCGLFSLRDFMLTVFIIMSLFFYLQSKFFCYSLSASFLVLTKDAGLLLPIWVLIIEIVFFLRKRFSLLKLASFSLPVIVSLLWFVFLEFNHQKPWSDWIFGETAAKGSMYTIVYNLMTLNFINQYTLQHWLHLFVLNFNWFFWLLAIIGLCFFWGFCKNKEEIITFIKKCDFRLKTFIIIVFFVISYLFTILSFPTYTIPRYILPLLPFMYLGASLGFNSILTKSPFLKFPFSAFCVVIVFLSLFFSVDPVSLKIWSKITLFGEKIYGLNQHLAGNDGMTYNMQYLFIVKKRTAQIETAHKNNNQIVSNDCYWMFPDPANDFRTMTILKITNKDKIFCLK